MSPEQRRLRASLLACTLFAPAAWAGPWYLGIAQSIGSDSNIYRIADDAAALPAGRSKSDTVYNTTLLAGVDEQIGRQRLRGDAHLRASRFDRNGSLDNSGYGMRVGLDWQTVGRVSGNVNLATNRSLARFSNDVLGATNLQRNLERASQTDAAVRVGVITRWTAEAGASYQTVGYSAIEFASREFRQSSLWGGLRYRPSNVTTLGAALRVTNGRFPRFARLLDGSFVSDPYDQRFVDLTATWAPTGASTYDARLSLGKTDYERASARDFSGATGALTWTWRPTGKLRFETRLARETGQDSAAIDFVGSGRFADSSRITNALRVQANVEASAKFTLYGSFGYAYRDLAETRTDLGGSPVALTGDDRTASVSLGGRWAPTRSITLGCEAAHEQRDHSGALSTDLSATSFGCFAQFTLQ
jgi:hypothetical protein